MARVSTKKDKTIYQQKREECGLTREKASEILKSITAERIERISLIADNITITVGAEKTLNAIISPSNATSKSLKL